MDGSLQSTGEALQNLFGQMNRNGVLILPAQGGTYSVNPEDGVSKNSIGFLESNTSGARDQSLIMAKLANAGLVRFWVPPGAASPISADRIDNHLRFTHTSVALNYTGH